MTISANDFQYISKLVQDLSAIVLEPGKEYLVESRITPLVNKEGLDSIEDLVRQLRTAPQNGLRNKVVDAMTTNETSFFRDIHPFETLKKFIIPDLIQKREAVKELNIWCGQHLIPEDLAFRVLVFLTETLMVANTDNDYPQPLSSFRGNAIHGKADATLGRQYSSGKLKLDHVARFPTEHHLCVKLLYE